MYVMRRKHLLCGAAFFEFDDEAIAKCPTCRRKLNFEECEDVAKEEIHVHPKTGKLKYKKDSAK
jgi:uncharacterized radical SAM superfamily Fe-S cluster-containing enzyme